MARVLLLSEYEAKTILYCTATAGHEVFVAGQPEMNRVVRHNPLHRRFIPLDNPLSAERCTPALADELEEIIARVKPRVLLPSSFDCIQIVSRFRHRFEPHCAVVPTPTLETIADLDDKYRFFEFCRSGLAHPESWLLDDATRLDDAAFLAELPFPLISKPTLGAGGEGLHVFETAEALRDHYLGAGSPDARSTLPVLLQEWFEGEDIDFNGFAVDGEVCAGSVMRTRRYTRRPEFTVTEFTRHDEAYALGARVVAASGYSGPLNIDMRIRKDDGTVQLIEVNPRFWARVITSLVDDLNFIDVAIRVALDPGYRARSGETGRIWASTLRDPLVALVRNRDAFARDIVSRITSRQVRYTAFARFAELRARIANRSADPD